MSIVLTDEPLDRLRQQPVLKAFLVSLIAHLVLFLALEFAREFRLVEKLRSVPMLRSLMGAELRPKSTDTPLVFVEVDPASVTDLIQEDTEFYSDVASRAANPEVGQEEAPEVLGSNEESTSVAEIRRSEEDGNAELTAEQDNEAFLPEEATEETAAPEDPEIPDPQNLNPLEGAPNEPEFNESALSSTQPGTDPSEQSLDVPEVIEESPSFRRPRTLKEARARQRQRMLEARKMRQEGGSPEYAEKSSLSVRVTGFGAYDRIFIEAVDNRWKQLLAENQYAMNRAGKVIVSFRLHDDGRVSQIDVAETTVGEVLGLLCRRAIVDPSPYRPWPSEMRRTIGATFRDIRFTFYYN